MSMIEIKNLTKYYGDVKALNEINFNVEKGCVTGLLGPNGAGKTTTLKIVTCYLKPSDGTVNVDGIDVKSDSIAIREKIGYLPENNPLYFDMLVYDFLKFIGSVHKIPNSLINDRIEKTVRLCGLKSVVDRKIQWLSKGFKQRVGLAAALLNEPEIVILDEPTSGLDPNQIVEIRELVKEIGKEKTVILSTHILSEVEVTCDHVIIINEGNIIADGKTSDLLQTEEQKRVHFGILTNGHSAESVKNELIKHEAITNVSVMPSDVKNVLMYNIFSSTKDDIRPVLFNLSKDKNWTCVELHAERFSLEERFRQLTKLEEK